LFIDMIWIPDLERVTFYCIGFYFHFFAGETTTKLQLDQASPYQIATYALGALAAVLIVISIALAIVICRMGPKDY